MDYEKYKIAIETDACRFEKRSAENLKRQMQQHRHSPRTSVLLSFLFVHDCQT